MKDKFVTLCFLCLLSVFLLVMPALGQVEYISNGGFETGDFTGWALAGDDTFAYVDNGSLFITHSGGFEALLGNEALPGTLSQTVATTPGTNYLLSFWFDNSFGDPGQFSVSWDGTVLFSETNPPATGWTNYEFAVTATQASSTVQFGFFDDAADEFGLDDVSLQAENNIAPTISVQPTSAAVNPGDAVTFAVVAAGSSPIGYQWLFQGVPIDGANSSSYTLVSALPANTGDYLCAVSNGVALTNSLPATLTVITNPVIRQQPTNQTVNLGDTATFSVVATAPEPLTYQWQFGSNGTNLPGATNATLNVVNAQPGDAGLYSVTVSTEYGSVVSSNATLTVLVPPPTITSQPTNQAVNVGDTATFSVTATATQPLTYQWQFGGNGTNIPGATNATLNVVNAQPTDAGMYSVTVSTEYASLVSSNATLTVVIIPPSITSQPTNQTVYAGNTATFNVVASAPQPLSYQWQFGDNGTNIAGATNATLSVVNAQPGDAGLYTVTISTEYASVVSSNATLSVLAVPPVIINQPTNQTIFVGGTANFSVTVQGPLPTHYQWSFNSTNLPGATGQKFTIANAQLNQAGNYSVSISNPYGFTNSVAAALTVNPAPPTYGYGLLSFPLSANQHATVSCLENPSVSYDIYLPPGYKSNANPLPIFYTMAASGGGMVTAFLPTCASMNIICVGISGSQDGLTWSQQLHDMYAVALDVRERVLFDPTAEFVGGFSGGADCSYMFSRLRAQHVAGVFGMGGWLGRVNSGDSVQYYGTDRVQTNLLVARATGTTDVATTFYQPFDSNYLATCGAVVKDWSYTGGHVVPPSSLYAPVLSWLINSRMTEGLSDFTNSFMLYTNWQARVAAGQQAAVLRECVSNLMNFPRSWYAYQAQATLDHLLTNYPAVRSLDIANLAQDDFASDLFFYYAYSAATCGDWQRYGSCMKALTGITITNDFDGSTTMDGITETVLFPTTNGSLYITTQNGDRAGDIYSLLTTYHRYPSPRLQGSQPPMSDLFNLWINEDTPGLGYSVQTTPDLLNAPWQPMTVDATDSNGIWSAGASLLPGANTGYFRIVATPSPATGFPWPH